MKKYIKISSSQKVQAAPVDFDSLDALNHQRSTPELIKNELESHKGELIAYADKKFRDLEKQINADINTIFDKYVDEEDVDLFEEILKDNADYHMHKTISEPSGLNGLEYAWMPDYDMVWVLIDTTGTDAFDDENFETLDVQGELFTNPNDQPMFIMPCYYNDDTSLFIEWLILQLSHKNIAEQIEVEEAVDICSQLIYGFVQFVDNQCSKYLEDAVKEFLANR